MGDSRQAKVHVHTDDPPRAIALGETIGLVSGVNIDDMHRQEEARAQRIERSMRAARGEVTGSVDRTIALTDANTALITDSTADLPDAMRAVNMRIVPVPVSFGTEAFDVSSAGNNAAFYERLATGGQNATTAAPSMGDLVDQYRQALESYEFAIVLHMSTTFSSTADVARRAALEVDPDRIFVIETESVSYQLALIVSRVQAALVRGTTLGDVEDLVDEFRRTQAMAFSLASLEYIQRGGRISKGRALVGNLLGVRPILQIAGGEIEQYSKIRGADRMMPGLRDFVVERTRDDIPLRVSVAHAVAPALIADLTAFATSDRSLERTPVPAQSAWPASTTPRTRRSRPTNRPPWSDGAVVYLTAVAVPSPPGAPTGAGRSTPTRTAPCDRTVGRDASAGTASPAAGTDGCRSGIVAPFALRHEVSDRVGLMLAPSPGWISKCRCGGVVIA
jgi:DegV family protein with EDD domain